MEPNDKNRRFKWFEHFMRQITNNLAKNASEHYKKYIKKPRSQPQETWMSVIRKDLFSDSLKFFRFPRPSSRKVIEILEKGVVFKL